MKQLILKTMFLLCVLIASSSSALAGDVTFTAGTDQGTNGTSGNPDSMEKAGVTISGTDFATTTAEYRIYSSSTFTISSIGTITKIIVRIQKSNIFSSNDFQRPITRARKPLIALMNNFHIICTHGGKVIYYCTSIISRAIIYYLY